MALSPDALKVVDDFGHAPGVTKVHVDQLKKLFDWIKYLFMSVLI
ncbi:hypothetical protein ACULMA_00680 [Xanthomonas arboricola pv. corylina]